jgi:ribonuclease HI
MRPLVYLYADESCLGVQFTDRDSPGGAAGLVEHWDGAAWSRRDYWLSEPATTNNRMALRSAIEGLRLLRRPCRVVFTSDSQYLVRGMREWIHGWMRRGWRRRDGPVENVELWQELVSTGDRHDVRWRWVRGHAGHPQNEYANHLATRAARTQDASDGLVPSGFVSWLATQREAKGHYLDFHEWSAPEEGNGEGVGLGPS